MFQFRRFPRYTYFEVQCNVPEYEPRWVSSFRDLRINAYLQLPEAYRSLSRLSSALSAKASTLCSFQLNQMSLRRGNGSETKVHSVAPLAVCLHFSVCISFDMPRMSCILNIYLRSFIQYAVFKVRSDWSLSVIRLPDGSGPLITGKNQF